MSASLPNASYPMRINKYLAHIGTATRRDADALIEKGRVFINGRKAVLGDKIQEGDDVQVRHISGERAAYRYFAYHKPRGVITHSPQRGEQDIRDTLKNVAGAEGVFPIGRLDKDSEGLIILTNDGRITDRLLNPEREHEKEYLVTTTGKLGSDFAEKMSAGVDIGDYVTKPCKVIKENDRAFRITLSEGKKHQIRRMVDTEKNGVDTLTRVRVMNIELGTLAPGALRSIEGPELTTLLKSLGL